ncbi:hypothetical protein [Luteolibacter luteus]|uniref:Uncharacterized protein n=1 Tax=Luteolibacter luteus TaxID=2728835 RepID=A0A858RPY9_9BACT|nr:hypothetical protein [Luteolibacter luteus]QJE98419.1 hypothetical protein HHL09_22400 [Luteolibacter luteus]
MLGSKKYLGYSAFACLLAAAVFIIVGARGPSKLPAYDSAEFVSANLNAPLKLQWEGDPAAAIVGLFEGANRDLNPSKWVFEGQLTLVLGGKSVGKIEVFSNSQGAGPFKIGDNYYLVYDQAAFQRALHP